MTEATSIATARVVSTPGIAIDGTRVRTGGLPGAARIDGWLRA